MGTDKTILPVGGRTMVSRVVDIVSSTCAETMLVTDRPAGPAGARLGPHVTVVTDDEPDQGPLGGLVTAIRHARHGWVLAVAADMPWLSADVIRVLWGCRTLGAQAVVPMTDRGVEPLLAFYRRDAIHRLEAFLTGGGRRLVDALDDLRVAWVPAGSLEAVDEGLMSFVNVNTPEDYEQACAVGDRRFLPVDGGRFASDAVIGGRKEYAYERQHGTRRRQRRRRERFGQDDPSGGRHRGAGLQGVSSRHDQASQA